MKAPKPEVVKDPEYLAWVRRQPCHLREFGDCIPFDTIGNGPSEASHVKGKSRDDLVIPLDGGHHRTGRFSWHRGSKTHQQHYGYDAVEVAKRYYQSFKEGK